MPEQYSELIGPLPAEVTSLGPPRQVYPASRFLQLFCWGTGILGLVASVGIIVLLIVIPPKGDSPGKWIGIGMSVLCLVFGVVLIALALSSRGLCHIVFDEALVRIHRGQTTIFRWNDIQEVRETALPAGNKYWLKRQDGQQMKLDYWVKNVNDLGGSVQGKVTARMLPSALRTLDQGEIVSFGSLLGLSLVGLTRKGEELDWEEVTSISVRYNPNVHGVQFQVNKK